MALDPHSYIRVLAVRHAIAREPGDANGINQARRAIAAELDEIRDFTAVAGAGHDPATVRHYLARARALESFTRFTLSLAEKPGTTETAAPQVPDEPGDGERAPRREPDRPTRPRRTVPAQARPKGSRARRRNRR